MHASAFIALGTNLPFEGAEGSALLARAVEAMREAGFELRAVSGVWRTPAWPPGSDQPDYFNAVVEADAREDGPRAIYDKLRAIEATFGRKRRARWESRTLDLDLLALGALSGVFDGIAVPHPRLQERVFVLAPFAEVAPDWRHPELGETVAHMLARLEVDEGYRRVSDLS
ncbi:MAG TPA: 2-amino-4-hydroxy-6-hydroxymethyldihydropteridine diphosphokinase [Vitreimonas sp.]|uniref:2-amino-4-hydroxy-6- hydroxymethyldihydropteridine diphosphokinase n=1 Tax=Vitreimonas sp. TaxID=3069702 RepID=UPI002D379CC2|nr:2-amino-4-hydroxy-6-hydroxymethyldihydropteridine diphosphokinase [Vitreimonas sp.]HYD88512.1 2-amino-4-hydroxy-6-hydroxymethyldihydropteridine diphosphokinase [Vitreimonas sp.]